METGTRYTCPSPPRIITNWPLPKRLPKGSLLFSLSSSSPPVPSSTLAELAWFYADFYSSILSRSSSPMFCMDQMLTQPLNSVLASTGINGCQEMSRAGDESPDPYIPILLRFGFRLLSTPAVSPVTRS